MNGNGIVFQGPGHGASAKAIERVLKASKGMGEAVAIAALETLGKAASAPNHISDVTVTMNGKVGDSDHLHGETDGQ